MTPEILMLFISYRFTIFTERVGGGCNIGMTKGNVSEIQFRERVQTAAQHAMTRKSIPNFRRFWGKLFCAVQSFVWFFPKLHEEVQTSAWHAMRLEWWTREQILARLSLFTPETKNLSFRIRENFVNICEGVYKWSNKQTVVRTKTSLVKLWMLLKVWRNQPLMANGIALSHIFGKSVGWMAFLFSSFVAFVKQPTRKNHFCWHNLCSHYSG